MKIAVIGATGNVGTAILRRLHESPDVDGIVGVSRRRPDGAAAPYHNVTWHQIDVGDRTAIDELSPVLRGVDAVIHLAWLLQPNHQESVLYRTNVTGTANLLAAAELAGVPHVICASSVGAYSPASKDTRVDETWPTGGIHTSHYSRHKAAQERLLDGFEARHPQITVSRLRPGLIFQGAAGSEIGRYFLGPFVPKGWLGRLPLGLLPFPARLQFQAVHSDDVAEAYCQVAAQQAAGAFNIAAEPVLGPDNLPSLLGAGRTIDLPVSVLRSAAALSWRLRVQRSDPGWVDMAAQAPLMSTERARTVLGWRAKMSAMEAAADVIRGLGSGDGLSQSPPLSPR
ncbi:NAD-dependent epimerase/dehydratase family protein [Saxibacter everestensis]|uniref:NAD-dependent epimerase/dehydratase family protein n=1 Tax=Saxibacter everestensis TaxID=2909229 RepID=A0ABY8QV45_9MICO|nr:NAD-dependent epimerase/dehydratase family protein [Brevibacteriaceae bacterium ZFBP1038]